MKDKRPNPIERAIDVPVDMIESLTGLKTSDSSDDEEEDDEDDN